MYPMKRILLPLLLTLLFSFNGNAQEEISLKGKELFEKNENKDLFLSKVNEMVELENKVKEMIKLGWKPIGGVSIGTRTLNDKLKLPNLIKKNLLRIKKFIGGKNAI